MDSGSVAERPVLPITVAISALDRPDALGRCLQSILYGSSLPSEIVVVDQGEDCRAGDVIDRLGDAVSIAYVRDAG